LKQGYIYIANNIFPTLLAISEEEQRQGLMYVDPPAPVMSFVYASPQINRMWMHNTKCPLDIIFCSQGKVSEICYGEPYSTRIIGDRIFSDLVVELPGGTVSETQIKIGQTAGLILDNPKRLFEQSNYLKNAP
jgi:uncharacterized membrane protein (UPF0127 family)